MGQMETLNLAFNQLHTIEGLTAFGRLNSLDLSSNTLTSLQGLKPCVQLQVLKVGLRF